MEFGKRNMVKCTISKERDTTHIFLLKKPMPLTRIVSFNRRSVFFTLS